MAWHQEWGLFLTNREKSGQIKFWESAGGKQSQMKTNLPEPINRGSDPLASIGTAHEAKHGAPSIFMIFIAASACWTHAGA